MIFRYQFLSIDYPGDFAKVLLEPNQKSNELSIRSRKCEQSVTADVKKNTLAKALGADKDKLHLDIKL